jgi:uncharacterized protein (DUF111 family)
LNSDDYVDIEIATDITVHSDHYVDVEIIINNDDDGDDFKIRSVEVINTIAFPLMSVERKRCDEDKNCSSYILSKITL